MSFFSFYFLAKVPKHLRFPFFAEIHWYLVRTYVEILERDVDERRKLEFEGIYIYI